MFRSHTCGELRLADAGKNVTLAGWVQRARKMGGMTFVDLRDRYGITQLVFNTEVNAELCERANHLGREFVIQVKGTVSERSSKNANIPTGEIEIIVSELNILNSAQTPPFTIEDNTDGGDDLRMKYRYLDLRCCTQEPGTPSPHDNGGSPLSGQQGLPGSGNSDADWFYSGRCTRLRGSFTYEPGTILCIASVSADFEAAANGFRLRPLFPDCKMFP